jgi:hypothetical protein
MVMKGTRRRENGEKKGRRKEKIKKKTQIDKEKEINNRKIKSFYITLA